jgi:hypothetical protein
VSVHSSFLDDESSKQGQSAKESRQDFPSGRVWKLWLELHGNFNPDDSIAETELELELALSKLKLTNKKNPRKLLEEIASCEVKYGVPVSDGKKVAQLIRLGGKKYGTVITVTQMYKKRKKGYVHRETHCGRDVETMANRRLYQWMFVVCNNICFSWISTVEPHII